MKISKITTSILWLLFAVSIFLVLLTLMGGDVEGATHKTPVYLDTIMFYTYGILIFCAALVLVLEIINIISSPAKSIKSVISFLLILVVIAIAYLSADGTPLNIPGYEGTDNVPSMLKVTDTGVFTFYVLGIVTVLAVIGFEIRSAIIKTISSMAKGKRRVSEINAASMADIAFLLLCFFMMVTTMNTDTGLGRMLPPQYRKK